MRSDNVKEAEAALRSEMLSQAVTSQQLYAQAIVEHVRLQIILKGCTKTTFDPLRAASNLGAKASCAR
jgi:hypothetical protein